MKNPAINNLESRITILEENYKKLNDIITKGQTDTLTQVDEPKIETEKKDIENNYTDNSISYTYNTNIKETAKFLGMKSMELLQNEVDKISEKFNSNYAKTM